jgi:hypothetical protein
VQQQQQQVQAATRAYIQQEDTKFHAHFEREFPQYASKAGRAEIRRGVQLALHKAGVSEEEVSQLWRSGALRAVQTQMILARAGAWELAQERAAIAREQLADKRAPIPPVQRPGVARPRGAGAEGDVRALSQQLENATGNAALRIATKLTQARRRAAGF